MEVQLITTKPEAQGGERNNLPQEVQDQLNNWSNELRKKLDAARQSYTDTLKRMKTTFVD
jgi:cation transport regulator ChaB